jgi:hypothetical protein
MQKSEDRGIGLNTLHDVFTNTLLLLPVLITGLTCGFSAGVLLMYYKSSTIYD